MSLWKAEYSAALTGAMYVEAREAGGYWSRANSGLQEHGATRSRDTGENTVQGGPSSSERNDKTSPGQRLHEHREKAGWGGDHPFRVGGEYMLDHLDAPFFGYGNSCNCRIHAEQWRAFASTDQCWGRTSRSGLVTSSGCVDDTLAPQSAADTVARGPPGSVSSRVCRSSRGPCRRSTSRRDEASTTFNNWGPRLGLERRSPPVTAGRVLKLHYGRFWLCTRHQLHRGLQSESSGLVAHVSLDRRRQRKRAVGPRGGGGAHLLALAAARPPDSIPTFRTRASNRPPHTSSASGAGLCRARRALCSTRNATRAGRSISIGR